MQQYGAMDKLQRVLGHQFSDLAKLEQALTHRSVKGQHNERLEFLGDAVLGMIVAEELFRLFPAQPEGKLTRMRASLVKGETLAKVAKSLGLGEHIKLGPGELKTGGQRRDSILADALEAVLGAIYLDANIDVVRQRVLAWFSDNIAQLDPDASVKDAKTRLQEYLQGRGLALPQYEVVDVRGAEHAQTFIVECQIPGAATAFRAEGSSRRRAEQEAARQALQSIQ